MLINILYSKRARKLRQKANVYLTVSAFPGVWFGEMSRQVYAAIADAHKARSYGFVGKLYGCGFDTRCVRPGRAHKFWTERERAVNQNRRAYTVVVVVVQDDLRDEQVRWLFLSRFSGCEPLRYKVCIRLVLRLEFSGLSTWRFFSRRRRRAERRVFQKNNFPEKHLRYSMKIHLRKSFSVCVCGAMLWPRDIALTKTRI